MKEPAQGQIASFYINKKEGQTGLKVNAGENLWLLVSLENVKLQGENLSAFFELIARQKKSNSANASISKIKIIITDSLNEHYEENLDDALKLGSRWLSENKKNWEDCQSLKSQGIEIELVYWNSLKTDQVKDREKAIRELYQTDQTFQASVDKLVRQHRNRAKCGDGLEKAKDYLFEECAVISCLTGQLCYPSNEFNEAIRYVVQYFNSNLKYNGFGLFPKKTDSQKSEGKSPVKRSKKKKPEKRGTNLENSQDLALTLALEAISRIGIFSSSNPNLEKREKFIGELNDLVDRYSSDEKLSDSGISKDVKSSDSDTANVPNSSGSGVFLSDDSVLDGSKPNKVP